MGLSSVSARPSAMGIAEDTGLFRKHGIDAAVIVIGEGVSPPKFRLNLTE